MERLREIDTYDKQVVSCPYCHFSYVGGPVVVIDGLSYVLCPSCQSKVRIFDKGVYSKQLKKNFL